MSLARSTLQVVGALGVARSVKSLKSVKSISNSIGSIKGLLLKVPKNLKFYHLILSCKSCARTHTNPLVLLGFLGFGAKKEEKIMAEEKTQFEQTDDLFDNNRYQEAIDLLKSFKDQEDSNVQWRLGRALFQFSKAETNGKKKEEMVRESYAYLKGALEKDDKNFAIHKWYAILLDAKSNLDGLKERVTQLENVKKHMLLAVELNPDDPTSRYILGEFSFGLADLPWYQRKVVAAIFATPPDGSYQEALEHFLKAESLKADFFATNKLLIGKCYYQLKDYEKAKEYYAKAASITPGNEDDRKCKEEAEKLLSKLK